MDAIRGETAPRLDRVKPWKAFIFLLLLLSLFPFFLDPLVDSSCVNKNGFQFPTVPTTSVSSVGR